LATGVGVIQAEIPGAVPLQVSEKAPNDSDVTWGICYPVAQTETRAEYLPESFHRGRISAVGIEGANLVAFESLLRTDHSLEDGCDGGPPLGANGPPPGMGLGPHGSGH